VHSDFFSGSGPASFPGIPENSVEFPDSVGIHVEIKSFGARIICSGILRNPDFRPEFRREGPRTWYSVPRVTNIY